jgi:molybdenum ABC transporter molybdate-binding protein
MSPDTPSWNSKWTVGVRIWVESAGRAMLGKGRLELLEGIDRWRSISAAARQMNMSYRRAWLLVQAMNEAAGEPLVEAVTGGKAGGGARLTPQGRLAMTVFRSLQRQVQDMAATVLPRLVEAPADASVHVAAAVSLEEVLGQLLADYTLLQPTVRVRAVFGGSDELAEHILAGVPSDLFLSADRHQLDRLERAGMLEPHSHTPLAENTLAAIAPTDSTLPIKRPADLLHPDLQRLALADPASPLGRYTREYLEYLGLYESLHERVIHVDNSRAVLAAVHASQADVGLVYGSDALSSACRLLFRTRRGAASVRYAAAVVRQGQDADRARTLLRFLTSPPAQRRFRRCGFLPVRAGD